MTADEGHASWGQTDAFLGEGKGLFFLEMTVANVVDGTERRPGPVEARVGV